MSEKWWDMSDDELDDLFREASDKVDVPFESSSFDKLRQKIDIQRKPEPAQGYKKRWLVLLAGLFLMVGIGLVYRFGNDLKDNNSTEIVKHENTPKRLDILSSDKIQNKDSKLSKSKKLVNENEILSLPKENLTKKSDPNKGDKTLLPSRITKQNLERLSVEPQTTTGEKTLLSSRTIKENLERSSVETQTTTTENNLLNNSKVVIENKQVTFGLNHPKTYVIEQDKVVENIDFKSINKKNKLIRFNNSKNNKDREGKSYHSNYQVTDQNALPIVENTSEISSNNLPEETINRVNFYNVDFLKNKESKSLLTEIHPELPDYVDSLPRTIKSIKFSKFGVRFVVSPDFNSIENLGKMALGGSVGLLLEYKISKKLIVQTGMVYSDKSYVGSFDDYRNWKEWKGYHPSKPTQVDGGCTVFDIPINLLLNLFQKPKQTWFVSSGVSSYWMMNENYTYNYAWTSPREVGWSDNSKYYFSVLNFSVGLERQISKQFSLQVEPYLKTPLKSVGRGGVNLYSSGVLFSTKYEF